MMTESPTYTAARAAEAADRARVFPPASDREGRAAYRAAEQEIRARFAVDLSREYLPDVAPEVADAVFQYAWEQGHSAGYQDVESVYGEIASIVHVVVAAQ